MLAPPREAGKINAAKRLTPSRVLAAGRYPPGPGASAQTSHGFYGNQQHRVAGATAAGERIAIGRCGRQSTDATFDWPVWPQTAPKSPGRALGTHGLGELVGDTLYLRSCQVHSVVPVSCFLCQGSAPELNLRHRGLGPQGAHALASSLSSNPYVKRLDLRDNGLCGAGAEALAGALSKSSSIHDLDLSENQLGVVGAQALCAALTMNRAVQKMQLSGNGLEEQAAQHLAELLLAHTDLKSLDLSYNQLNDQAGVKRASQKVSLGVSEGEILGPALAENTGLTELNVSWNHLRGPGAVAFARGLEVSRNPMRSEGCFGLLKSVQDNPASALELLDFSDIQVNTESDDLANAVKRILPALCIKSGARKVEYKKELLPVFRPALPVSVPK
ncbi:leucine-rich repeat-containing protein 74B isoform X5 [Callithrix jacchus]|uniref:leucine-rich repeat-containing protein 74B isoform X5 n=1 Tax=Callithrix jacchus TaxID=9483 RepID=UPI0023DCF9C7|nr:leucine-rich repeat-containing protein 74B isoform X5 [Callithrix jacchus]